MLELLLGRDYGPIERRELTQSFIIALAVYASFFLVICFMCYGSGNPTKFQFVKQHRRGIFSQANASIASIPSKRDSDQTVITTVWGDLSRARSGKIILTPAIMSLLLQCNKLESIKPKSHLKKDKKSAKKSKEIAKKEVKKKSEQATLKKLPVSSIVPPQPAQQKVMPLVEKKNSVVDQPLKSEPQKQKQENTKILIVAEEKAKIPALQIPSEATPNESGRVEETRGGDESLIEESQGGIASSLSNELMGIEFNDGTLRNEMPDSYYERFIGEINALIDEKWNPLAGWEDAGMVVVEIRSDVQGNGKATLLEMSKAASKNYQALAIGRYIARAKVLRGRTFSIRFK